MWFGEVSLAGEVRPVAHGGLRLREAAKLGFERGFGPDETAPGSGGLRYEPVMRISKLVDRVMANA